MAKDASKKIFKVELQESVKKHTRKTPVTTTTGELPNDKRDEHLKNVFSFHFFENLFLESLLNFLSSILC